MLKQLVLPILCELVYASARARELLWRVGGVSVYVDLLGESYWQVPALSAIHYWYVVSTPFGTIIQYQMLLYLLRRLSTAAVATVLTKRPVLLQVWNAQAA